MKYFFSLLLVLMSSNLANSQEIDNTHFDKVDAFLGKYVSDGSVNYQSVRLNNDLSLLINEIAGADLSNLKPSIQKAFYINAYNLNVINKIIDLGNIESVMDIEDFFEKSDIKIAGRILSLNGLEKNMIFRKFDDARLHFVLVCGAIGCPPLAEFAYRPESLEKQLKARTSKTVNNTAFVKLVGDSLRLSQIFNWYSSDFGKTDIEVVEFINRFKENQVPTQAVLQYTNYDWSLNGK